MVRNRGFHRLFRRYLLTELADFAAFKNMVVQRPIGHHLRAVSFGTSAYDRYFVTVNALVQPLYVPFDAVFLTYAIELGYWQFEAEVVDDSMREIRTQIRTRGLPHLERLGTPERLARAYSGPLVSSAQLWHAACAWTRAGDERKARETLERVAREGEKSWDDRIDWHRREREQIVLLLETLSMKGLPAAQRILDDWERETRTAIGLDRLLDETPA